MGVAWRWLEGEERWKMHAALWRPRALSLGRAGGSPKSHKGENNFQNLGSFSKLISDEVTKLAFGLTKLAEGIVTTELQYESQLD